MNLFTPQFFILCTLFLYLPFHVTEEAFGNFPNWMYTHHWTPTQLSYGHWLAVQIIIWFPFLLVGCLTYLFLGESFLFAGIGVLFWGMINFGEHTFFSIKDHKLSPGFFTGILFGLNSLSGFYRISVTHHPSLSQFIFGIVLGSFFFAGALFLNTRTYKKFKVIFQ